MRRSIMKKRILAGILVLAICMQFTSCVYVQDALYDMGVNVDFEEAWDGIQAEWDNNSTKFSADIKNMMDIAIDSINNFFKKEELPDTAIPIESSEYYLNLPMERVELPASQRTVYLLPLYGYGNVSAYRRSDNKEVSLAEAGITLTLENSRDKFTLDEYGTICGRQGGIGYFSCTYVVDGEVREQIDNIAVFVAECDFSATDTTYTFSEEEKMYITTCLDLSYTLYKAQETSSMLEWNPLDDVLLNVSNLSDNMAAFFRGEPMKEAQVKRVFSDFYQGYVNEYITETSPVFNWKVLETSVKMLETIKNSLTIKQSLREAIEEAIDIYRRINDFTSSKAVTFQNICRMVEIILMVFRDTEGLESLLEMEGGLECLTELGMTLKEFIKELFKLPKIVTDGSVAEFMDRAFKTNGALDKTKIAGEAIKVGFNLFDTITFVMCDYYENIRYLDILKDGLLKYKSTLSPEDTSVDWEIHYIDELIDDYNNKYSKAAGEFVSELLTQGVEMVAGFSKIYSFVKFIADIAALARGVTDKEKVTILSLYASAAFHTLEPIHDLFMYGKISENYQNLEYSVSLYLNLLLEINNTIYKNASGEDKKVIQKNKTYITETLKPYLSVD